MTLTFELIFLIVFTPFLLFGLYFIRQHQKLKSIGIAVRGTIVDHKEKKANDGTSYFPIVEFVKENGEKERQTLGVGYGKKSVEGTMVNLIYDPNKPSQIMFNSRVSIIGLVLLLIGIAGVTIALLGYTGVVDYPAIENSPSDLPF